MLLSVFKKIVSSIESLHVQLNFQCVNFFNLQGVPKKLPFRIFWHLGILVILGKSGQIWAFWAILGILGNSGQIWAILGKSGQIWAFWAECPNLPKMPRCAQNFQDLPKIVQNAQI